MQDVKRLISEVAAQNGIRVEPDDPLFALVTINRIVLEDAAQKLRDQIHARISEFDASYQRADRRSGSPVEFRPGDSAKARQRRSRRDQDSDGPKKGAHYYSVPESAVRRIHTRLLNTAQVRSRESLPTSALGYRQTHP